MKKGITYTTTGDRERSQMNNYHRKPRVIDLSKGATENDVRSIKSKVTQSNRIYQSNYTIGFEIEKNQFGRGQRKEYALIQGYERDGSCGVEAVTNILPLLPPSQWRNKVFDMVFKAKGILDDDKSPSNQRCGGHITIGVNGLYGEELLEKVRLNASILMALFRKRLKNGYCRHNLRMQHGDDSQHHWNRWHHKYQLALTKGSVVEFRLPNRISSYKQMFRRYELMYHIVDFSVTKPNGRFDSLLKKVEPIILSMYEGDKDKVEYIKTLAKDFRKFVKSGEIHERIVEFI